jgi:hypothetical protein
MVLYSGGGVGIVKFLNTEKVIQLISGVKTHDSCRHIFMEYRLPTVASLYISELLCIIKKNSKGI